MTYERRTVVPTPDLPDGYAIEYVEVRGYDSPDRGWEAMHYGKYIGQGSVKECKQICLTHWEENSVKVGAHDYKGEEALIHVCSDGIVIGVETEEGVTITLVKGRNLKAMQKACNAFFAGDKDPDVDAPTFILAAIHAFEAMEQAVDTGSDG